jgi:hypothetical protein
MKDHDIDALARAYKKLSKRELRLKLIKKEIPPKEGTAAHARWTLLFKQAEKGADVLEYIADRGNPETLRRALKQGSVAIEKPSKKKTAGTKRKTSRYPKTTKSKLH